MSTPPHHSQALKALKAKEGNESFQKQAKGGELLSPGIFCPLSPAEGGGDRPRNISGVEPKQSQCNTEIQLKPTTFLVETNHIFGHALLGPLPLLHLILDHCIRLVLPLCRNLASLRHFNGCVY